MSSQYQTNWDLKKYFYTGVDDPQIDLDYENVEKLTENFIRDYKGKIKDLSDSDFLSFFSKDEELQTKLYKIILYFGYQSALDTQNQDIIKKSGELELKLVDLSNKLLFVATEFKELGYDKLIELSKKLVLVKFQNYFVEKANLVKYLLDEKTEKALNLKENSGANAFNKLYEELTNSFEFEIEIDGQIKKITEEEIRALRMSEDEETRRKAFTSINNKFLEKPTQITLGNTYNALVKDWTSEIKIRGFKTPLSQRNLSEQMPDEAVDLLFTEVKNRYDLYQRFLKIKHNLLLSVGQQKDTGNKLKSWNILAPISTNKVEYEFETALELFLETAKNFDSEIYELAKGMFTTGRVDVFPKLGKRGGAFASYEKNFDSFVLLNYTSTMNDVSTIAHELGHAVHGMLSQKQPSQVYGTGLCLAETASVFNEMLFAESFYPALESNEEKIHFLVERIQGIFSTIFSQIMYASFEKEVHQTIAGGKDLTYSDFNRLWRKHQAELYGEMVEFDTDEDQATGWSAIPHIFVTPFYVYSYAFGNILTFSLFSKFKQEGQSFVPKYKAILSAGGSLSPYELLIKNDINILDPEFYRHGLNELEKMIIELENLTKNS